MLKGSLFSTPSPEFIVCRLFDDDRSYQCEMIPHCGFDLHFSNSQWFWASFHVIISHLYIIFSEMSSSPFLIGLFLLLILSHMSCLNILEINSQLCSGEGGTLQTPLAYVWSTCSGWSTWVLPQPKVSMHLPVKSHLGSQVSCKAIVPGGPCVSSEELALGCDTPDSWNIWAVQDPRKAWVATSDLLTAWWQMPSLGSRLRPPLAFCVWLLYICLSASEAINGSQLAPLHYSLVHDTLFCEHARSQSVAFSNGVCKNSNFGISCCCCCW